MDEQENKEKEETLQNVDKDEVREELPYEDPGTTFADMNIEGFRWYNPRKKKGEKGEKINVSRKEYWSMVRGAFAAYLPMFLCIIASFGLVFLLAYLWLMP